jgi:hypothetical protein
MSAAPTAERERPSAEYNFIDKAVPEKIFNAEMRRIDYGQTGIEKTLLRIEAKIDRESAKNEERFDKIYAKFDRESAKNEERFEKINAQVDNHFYWVVGTMLVFTGLFSSIVFAIFKG